MAVIAGYTVNTQLGWIVKCSNMACSQCNVEFINEKKFNNCTNCGEKLTIATEILYFAKCTNFLCRKESEDGNAACPYCGHPTRKLKKEVKKKHDQPTLEKVDE